ncbi:hypothetical protein KVV02_005268 [Mortierella alpina]|uniref:F-box domain-containing protein n=1 Tax=Mortierella alpina TaxID=64518 RepID=A0A9P8A2V6_MORAP|nr:hypothetical protein KVV02_005268 [Mortierella alpina]
MPEDMVHAAQEIQRQCSFFFELPTELQLLIMSKLTLLELHNAKLICKRFQNLANVDQLWLRLLKEAKIDNNILEEARASSGIYHSWQNLLRTATIIERENKRVLEGTVTQMAQKIHQVRDALERQTRVLEETHQKLAQLSNRLSQMEYQNRAKELERRRAREREEQRLEDERWIRAWDDLHMSGEHISHGQCSVISSARPRLGDMEDVRVGLGRLDTSATTDANQMEDIRAVFGWGESTTAVDMKGKEPVDRGQGPGL